MDQMLHLSHDPAFEVVVLEPESIVGPFEEIVLMRSQIKFAVVSDKLALAFIQSSLQCGIRCSVLMPPSIKRR